jgi:hypothetical protein
MVQTGVNISLEESGVTANARRITDSFEGITKSAEDINAAFDPQRLDQYNSKLKEISQSYGQMSNQANAQRSAAGGRAGGMMGTIQSVPGAVAQAGRGDVAGAALNTGGKGLSSLATSVMGGPGAMIAGLAIAGGVATNALADAYSDRSGPAQRLAALQDQLYADVDANTTVLRQEMANTVEAVSRFGKTYAEGAAARESFLRAGGTNLAGSRAAEYSTAYAADYGALSRFEGLGQRYGQERGLDTTWATLRAQGLGPGQFEEVMGGIEETFTSLLSQGIVRSFEDIGRSQDFFSRAGQTWQGGIGAQRLQGMNQVVSQAGGLQSESDLFLYRAAAAMTEDGDMLETKKLMEQGLTPEMFQGLMSEYEKFGYGRTESIMQLSRTFGLSTTAAEELYDMKGAGMINEDYERRQDMGMATGMGLTRETQYTATIERIIQIIAGELGGGAFDVRSIAVGGGEKIIKFFQEMIEMTPEEANRRLDESEERNRQISQNMDEQLKFEQEIWNPAGMLGENIRPHLERAMASGVTYSQLNQALGAMFKESTAVESEEGAYFSAREESAVISKLDEVIAAVLATIEVEGAMP